MVSVSGVQYRKKQLGLFLQSCEEVVPVTICELFITRFLLIIVYRLPSDAGVFSRSLVVLSSDMADEDFRRFRVMLSLLSVGASKDY